MDSESDDSGNKYLWKLDDNHFASDRDVDSENNPIDKNVMSGTGEDIKINRRPWSGQGRGAIGRRRHRKI